MLNQNKLTLVEKIFSEHYPLNYKQNQRKKVKLISKDDDSYLVFNFNKGKHKVEVIKHHQNYNLIEEIVEKAHHYNLPIIVPTYDFQEAELIDAKYYPIKVISTSTPNKERETQLKENNGFIQVLLRYGHIVSSSKDIHYNSIINRASSTKGQGDHFRDILNGRISKEYLYNLIRAVCKEEAKGEMWFQRARSRRRIIRGYAQNNNQLRLSGEKSMVVLEEYCLTSNERSTVILKQKLSQADKPTIVIADTSKNMFERHFGTRGKGEYQRVKSMFMELKNNSALSFYTDEYQKEPISAYAKSNNIQFLPLNYFPKLLHSLKRATKEVRISRLIEQHEQERLVQYTTKVYPFNGEYILEAQGLEKKVYVIATKIVPTNIQVHREVDVEFERAGISKFLNKHKKRIYKEIAWRLMILNDFHEFMYQFKDEEWLKPTAPTFYTFQELYEKLGKKVKKLENAYNDSVYLLNKNPETIIHADAHPKNWFGAIILGDKEFATEGNTSRDIVRAMLLAKNNIQDAFILPNSIEQYARLVSKLRKNSTILTKDEQKINQYMLAGAITENIRLAYYEQITTQNNQIIDIYLSNAKKVIK